MEGMEIFFFLFFLKNRQAEENFSVFYPICHLLIKTRNNLWKIIVTSKTTAIK